MSLCCLSFYLRILIILLVSSNSSWEFESRSWRDILDTTLCEKVCQWLDIGWWFSPGTSASSINKTYRHDINEILLKVALKTITLTLFWPQSFLSFFELRLPSDYPICVFKHFLLSTRLTCFNQCILTIHSNNLSRSTYIYYPL
jgi:hypothetical protein